MRNNQPLNLSTALSQMLAPVCRSLDAKSAWALTALRIAPRFQARVEKLAGKCNEGRLTAAERSEYEAFIQASTLIGVLQAKVRRLLAKFKHKS